MFPKHPKKGIGRHCTSHVWQVFVDKGVGIINTSLTETYSFPPKDQWLVQIIRLSKSGVFTRGRLSFQGGYQVLNLKPSNICLFSWWFFLTDSTLVKHDHSRTTIWVIFFSNHRGQANLSQRTPVKCYVWLQCQRRHPKYLLKKMVFFAASTGICLVWRTPRFDAICWYLFLVELGLWWARYSYSSLSLSFSLFAYVCCSMICTSEYTLTSTYLQLGYISIKESTSIKATSSEWKTAKTPRPRNFRWSSGCT